MVTSFLNRFAPIDFTRYIDRLTDRFTGREWLFENHIEPWLKKNDNEQFYLLTGEPGVGKSAIVAELIKRWQTQRGNEEQGKLAAYHFCRAGDVETVRPGRVLRSIAAQLGKTLPHYGKALNKVLEQVHLNIDVKINIDTLSNSQVTGIYIENLKELDPREELRLLIQAPLAEIPKIYKDLPEEERAKLPALPTLKVFLIDSLDEAVTTTGRDNVATLLAELSQDNSLPPWIRFILTARPDSHALQGFESVKPYKLEKLLTENLEDIEQYVHKRVQEDIQRPKIFLAFWWKWYWELEKEQLTDDEKLNLWFVSLIYHLIARSTQPRFNLQFRLDQAELSTKTLVDEVKKLSEGNFLYTRLVMDGIGTGELSLKNLSALPKNLYEVYQRFLRHRCSVRKWIDLYQPLLGTLTVTQEAISSAQLTKFAKVASDQVEGVPKVESAIAILQQFLDEVENDEGQKLYTIFHQSLREYLLDRKHNHDFWCDAKEQHDNIIEYCKGESKGWEDLRAIDLYGLRHLAQHLVKAKQIDELHRLLNREKDGRNAWFDAKDWIGGIAGFLADVRLAWQQADENFAEQKIPHLIGLQSRYGLMISSINRLAESIPVELLVALVKRQVWTVEKGLFYALQVPDLERRVNVIATLSDCLPEDLKQKTLQQALDFAQTIQDKETRAEILAVLANKCPEDTEVFIQALQAAQVIEKKNSRDDALAKLAPILPLHLIPQFLQVAYSSQNSDCWDKSDCAKVLIALAPKLTREFLSQALQIAQAIQDEFDRTKGLIALADQFPDILPLAQETAQAIQDRGSRAKALIALTPSLPEELLFQALQAIQLVQNQDDLIQVLIVLADSSPEMLSQSLQAIQLIQNKSGSSEFQAKIMSTLSGSFAQSLPSLWAALLEGYRAGALIALIPKLPEKLLPQAIQTAQAIKHEQSRIQALLALNCKLTEDSLHLIMPVIQSFADEVHRFRILESLALKLPVKLMPQVLQIVQEIQSENIRAYTIGAIADKLSEDLLLQALQLTQKIQDQGCLALTLAALTDNFPEGFQQTLKVALEVQEERERAQALTALAERQPEAKPHALESALQISNDANRIEALLLLADKFPEMIPNAFQAIQTSEDGYSRSEALAKLAANLPSKLLPKALQVIQKIQEEDYRAKALIALVPYLPVELFAQALQIALQIPEEHERSEALIALAPRLPVELLPQVLQAVMQFQRKDYISNLLVALTQITERMQKNLFVSSDEELSQSQLSFRGCLARIILGVAEIMVRIGRSIRTSGSAKKLIVLAPELHKELFVLTFQAAQEDHEDHRAETIANLASILPEDFFFQALQITQTIKFGGSRAYALTSLASRLPEELFPQALQITQEIEHGYFRVRALVALADKHPELLLQAHQVALAIGDKRDQAIAMTYLAAKLPNIVPEVFRLIRNLDEIYRPELIEALLPNLSEKFLPQALQTALEIQDSMSFYKAYNPLLSILSREMLIQALQASRSIKNDRSRAEFLIALLPELPEEFLPQAFQVAEKILDEGARTNILIALIPKLPEDFLSQAFQAAQRIQSRDKRDQLLTTLASRSIQMSTEQQSLLWQTALHSLSNNSRPELLRNLAKLTPLIFTLGEETAVAEVFHAVQDIAQWWK
jgi:hypothetical protein